MPEVQTQDSQTKLPASPGAPQDAVDEFASLHKMSTTAGLGSQDYVAINPLAVTAALLGLASAISLLHNVLLVIPAAGVVFAAIAIRQINRSNGTQIGTGLAWLGLVLSVLFAGYGLFSQMSHAAVTRADREQIAALIEQLGRDVSAGDWDAAYALFSPRFQERINRQTFEQRFSAFQVHPLYGGMESMEWNQRIRFQRDVDGTMTWAEGTVWIRYEQAQDVFRHSMVFRKVGDRWLVENFEFLFPTEPMM